MSNERPEGLDALPRDLIDALVHAEPRSRVPPPTLRAEYVNLLLLRRELALGRRGGPSEGGEPMPLPLFAPPFPITERPRPVGDGWGDEG